MPSPSRLSKSCSVLRALLPEISINDIEGLSNPTTEHVAMWIWNKLENDLSGLSSVSVSEGNSYGCKYYGEKNA